MTLGQENGFPDFPENGFPDPEVKKPLWNLLPRPSSALKRTPSRAQAFTGRLFLTRSESLPDSNGVPEASNPTETSTVQSLLRYRTVSQNLSCLSGKAADAGSGRGNTLQSQRQVCRILLFEWKDPSSQEPCTAIACLRSASRPHRHSLNYHRLAQTRNPGHGNPVKNNCSILSKAVRPARRRAPTQLRDAQVRAA